MARKSRAGIALGKSAVRGEAAVHRTYPNGLRMTHLGNGAAIEMMLICVWREEQSSFLARDH